MKTTSGHSFDVIVVGGGLAGLSASMVLALSGFKVAVMEKKYYPRHKVCGEYVSNEVLPVLNAFGVDPVAAGATRINRFQLSSPSGKTIDTTLPLGAFGISRFLLDKLLADRARKLGVVVLENTKVRSVDKEQDSFEVSVGQESYTAKFVLGAFGKGSNLAPSRKDVDAQDRGKYVAVKRHINFPFPDDLVALHNFAGGYCGVSKVEESRVNLCYLARSKDLKRFGSIDQFEKNVLGQNRHLAEILENSESLFEQPLTISNFRFGARHAVVNHVLMIGDSAGMISPLCGNGMAMAIQSGYRAGEILAKGLALESNRSEVEEAYVRFWNRQFSRRLWWGTRLQQLFNQPVLANTAIAALCLWPGLTPRIIEKTHGQPILV